MERIAVQAIYDARPDTLSIILRAEALVVESDEDNLGVVLDCGAGGNLVSFKLEILDASKRVTEAHQIEFQTVG
jgi:hypothetical protein